MIKGLINQIEFWIGDMTDNTNKREYRQRFKIIINSGLPSDALERSLIALLNEVEGKKR